MKKTKMIVPLLIFIVVLGIWFIKNLQEQAFSEGTESLKYPLTVTSVNIDTLQEHNLPMIIDFGADSCIPCKEMAPVLKKLNKEMQDKAIIQFVDVWKNPDSAKNFPIQVIPTQLFYTADATPYVPSNSMKIPFTLYNDKNTGEHLFTVHQGGLTETQMRSVLHDMGVH